jgi:hypothetical protein
MESFGSKARPIAEKEALLSFILFFKCTLTQSPLFTRSVSGIGMCPAGHFRGVFFQRIDLGFRHWS